MSDEYESRPIGSMPRGREIARRYPPGVVGYADVHKQASEHRVAQARRFFPEASVDDFEVIAGTNGRRWRDRATGREYRRDGSDPLQLRDPKKSAISCFVILGWQIVYLRPRGQQAVEESVWIGDVPQGGMIKGVGGAG